MPSLKTGHLECLSVTFTGVLCHPIESFAYIYSFTDLIYKFLHADKLRKTIVVKDQISDWACISLIGLFL